MTLGFEELVVGIWHEKRKQIFGTGFIIAPKIVITCVHVVDAVGVSPAEKIKLTYFKTDNLLEATVEATAFHRHNDVAILVLDEPLPNSPNPIKLGYWQGTQGKEFWSMGYRPMEDFKGVPAIGKILNKVSKIDRQEPPDKPVLTLSSQQIREGMSGSPIYVPEINRIVGMVTTVWRHKYERDTCFAISAEAIVSAWPDISLHASGESVSTTFTPSLQIISLEQQKLGELREDFVLVNADIGVLRKKIQEADDEAVDIKKDLNWLDKQRREIDNQIKKLEVAVKNEQINQELQKQIDYLMKKLFEWKNIHRRLQRVYDEVNELEVTINTVVQQSKNWLDYFKKQELSADYEKQLRQKWRRCEQKLSGFVSLATAVKYIVLSDDFTEYCQNIKNFTTDTKQVIISPLLTMEHIKSLNLHIVDLKSWVSETFEQADGEIIELIQLIQKRWEEYSLTREG